jgi:hypothetical protein
MRFYSSRGRLVFTFATVSTAIIVTLGTITVAQQSETDGAFDLSWRTADGGGGTSTGGGFEISGTIGQPDASATSLTGGEFSVSGGFWSGTVEPGVTCPADVALPHNGLVDIDDLVVVITNWNSAGGQADVNHDLIVNIDDLVAVIIAWGMCP